MEIRTGQPPVTVEPDFTLEFISDGKEKNIVLDQLLQLLVDNKYAEAEELFWPRLVLDEALVNSMKHGNKYNPELKVTVKCFFESEGWTMLVEDEGDGFGQEMVISKEDDDSLLLDHGRGLDLMADYMTEVIYYNNGRSLWLHKKKES